MHVSPERKRQVSHHASYKRFFTRKLRLVMQDHEADCGAACLAMILASFGCHVTLHQLADDLDAGRDGTNAALLLNLARRYGLNGRGFHADVVDLSSFSVPFIAHVNRVHFVVVTRISRGIFEILDPARGVRNLTAEQLSQWYSGTVLVFETSEQFRATSPVRVPWTRYRTLMFGIKRHLLAVLGLSLLLRASVLLVPAISEYVVDHVLPARDWHQWQLICTAAGGFLLTYATTECVRAWHLSYVKRYIDERTTANLIDHILMLPFRTIARLSPGGVISRFGNNASLRDALSQGSISFLLDSLFTVIYLVAMLRTSLRLACACIFMALLHAALMVLSSARTRELSLVEVDALSEVSSFALETIRGIEVLKVFGAEASSGNRWKELSRKQVEAVQARAIWAGRVDAIGSGLNIGGSLLILLVGASLAMLQRLSVGQLFGFAALAGAFFGPLAGLSSGFRSLVLSETHLGRVEDLFRYEPEKISGAPVQQVRGQLELSDVWFRYSHSSEWTLSGLSMSIGPGEFVAIIGRSGCGKSTVARLLARLYTPSRGVIMLDESIIDQIDLKSYRQQLSVALQGAHIFSDSIASNILLDRPLDGNEEVLTTAAELASIRSEIEAMPMKFDTPLNEAGRNVSGGQRQRICIARAIARNPAVLILDEATSEVDPITEQRIFANLRSLPCTKIVVAHRMELVRMADRIIVIDKGKVAEHGSHEELSRLGGIYCQLVASRSPTLE